ncbi:glycosyltransferase [Flavobacterium hibisci]|uniref:glycosyltransferase n=1 Tax=Flavobacterium hibisci TaxID=1914462 RepID=UPI001CBC7E52|nr:glycosyltransferase [Flavobacterium hibisci]MBZ4041936.1 glycosyltransferase [Flavobacterium hibisci]
MKFTIITHVNHTEKEGQYFGYAPYVREMNVWSKYIDELIIVAPFIQVSNTEIDSAYNHKSIKFLKIENIDLLGFKSICNAILKIPKIGWQIFKAMKESDHIHLRCPGNIGLLGCFVQILFPTKLKTAKYAGNWDPKSKQPWSYRLQKWILNNTFLTRNMQVLVYGEWNRSTRNIKPFFTATYSEQEKLPIKALNLKEKIHFVFVGTLSSGKNPLYAIQLVEVLFRNGHNVILELYGEGTERKIVEDYITSNGLEKIIVLHGNKNQETVKMGYQNSHFVILPSKSEGWPKAIAEGMFWGCVPISTKISCVPFMLDNENRGLLLEMELNKDVAKIENIINNEYDFIIKSKLASQWSQQFTLEIFEDEIKKLIVK